MRKVEVKPNSLVSPTRPRIQAINRINQTTVRKNPNEYQDQAEIKHEGKRSGKTTTIVIKYGVKVIIYYEITGQQARIREPNLILMSQQ